MRLTHPAGPQHDEADIFGLEQLLKHVRGVAVRDYQVMPDLAELRRLAKHVLVGVASQLHQRVGIAGEVAKSPWLDGMDQEDLRVVIARDGDGVLQCQRGALRKVGQHRDVPA